MCFYWNMDNFTNFSTNIKKPQGSPLLSPHTCKKYRVGTFLLIKFCSVLSEPDVHQNKAQKSQHLKLTKNRTISSCARTSTVHNKTSSNRYCFLDFFFIVKHMLVVVKTTWCGNGHSCHFLFYFIICLIDL